MIARCSITAFSLVSISLSSCSGEQGQAAEKSAPSVAAPQREPIQAFQAELLQVAHEAASAFPTDSALHVKNRSRAQEHVVSAALKAGSVDQARAFTASIIDWRRGACLADLASYALQHDPEASVQALLDEALREADKVLTDPNQQKWRRDRVVSRVARAMLLQGRAADVVPLVDGLELSEMRIVAATRAEVVSAQHFDRQLEIVDGICENGGFEQVRGALGACTRLYERFFEDAEKREALRQRVVHGYAKLPVPVRIQLIAALTDTALDRGDVATAKALIQSADEYKAQAQFQPEHDVPLTSRLAGLRGRAGDVEQAREELAGALADFDSELRTIIDMFRARVLRTVAEAYQSFGDTEAAHAVYARTIEAGIRNPNSRPRAIDLAETCCSMALSGVQPSEKLFGRMKHIRSELGAPW